MHSVILRFTYIHNIICTHYNNVCDIKLTQANLVKMLLRVTVP